MSLQRGRGRETAEGRRVEWEYDRRGRFNGAAVVRPRKVKRPNAARTTGVELQRGRGRETAEGAAALILWGHCRYGSRIERYRCRSVRGRYGDRTAVASPVCQRACDCERSRDRTGSPKRSTCGSGRPSEHEGVVGGRWQAASNVPDTSLREAVGGSEIDQDDPILRMVDNASQV